MRVVRFLQAGVLILTATFCTDLPIGDIGISSPAMAKDFWTKKRVNGRWVKGHFEKHAGHESASSRRRARLEREREARAEVKDTKETPKSVTTGSIGSTGPAGETPSDVILVTFDVKAKTKTITFSDGKVVTRPFEINDFVEPTTPQRLIADQDAAEKLRAALDKRAETLRTGTASR